MDHKGVAATHFLLDITWDPDLLQLSPPHETQREYDANETESSQGQSTDWSRPAAEGVRRVKP